MEGLRVVVSSLAIALLASSARGEFPLRAAAMSGQPAPGVGGGFLLTRNIDAPALDDNGAVAFSATAEHPFLDIIPRQGIWAGEPGKLELVAIQGEVAPGSEYVFMSLGMPVMYRNGKLAFLGITSEPSPSGKYGIWSGVAGDIRLIATSGDKAPGAEPGATFNYLYQPKVDSSGAAAFRFI
jgi:hypothetical protein